MAGRKSATKKSGKKRKSWKNQLSVEPAPPLSAFARNAQGIFERGVQDQFKELAKKNIATIGEVNGRVVRGVPVKRGQYYYLIPVQETELGNRLSTSSARHSAKGFARKRS